MSRTVSEPSRCPLFSRGLGGGRRHGRVNDTTYKSIISSEPEGPPPGLMAVRRARRRSRSCSPQVPLDLADRLQPPRHATSRTTGHHPLPSQVCFTSARRANCTCLSSLLLLPCHCCARAATLHTIPAVECTLADTCASPRMLATCCLCWQSTVIFPVNEPRLEHQQVVELSLREAAEPGSVTRTERVPCLAACACRARSPSASRWCTRWTPPPWRPFSARNAWCACVRQCPMGASACM